MSFSDNLENSLKNLESHDERDAAGGAKSQAAKAGPSRQCPGFSAPRREVEERKVYRPG